jgi:hypothetical protein
VVTGKKRFNEYLEDAERLFLEVHSNDVDGKINVVGYSIIERLNRLTEINSISEDLVNNCIKSFKAKLLDVWFFTKYRAFTK